MDKLIQIASQELVQKEIPGDQDIKVSISVYDTNTILAFSWLSLSQILYLPEPNLEKRDHRVIEYLYGNSDLEKNQSISSSISNMFYSKIPWKQNVIKDGLRILGSNAKMLEAKKLMEREMACNDVISTSDGTKTGEVIGLITDKIMYGK